MKTRLLLIAVILLVMMGMQGCTKTWSVDFTRVSNIDNWLLKSNYEIIPGVGLLLDDSNNVTAPMILTGDFSITVRFLLDTDSQKRVFGSIWLGSEPNYPFTGSIISFFYRHGGVIDPFWEIWTDGPTTSVDIMATSSTEIPGMVNGTINTYTIVKTGDAFEARLNGTLLAEWLNTRYESATFYLTLNSGDIDNDQIIYKSVRIEADSSNMTPAALPLSEGTGSEFRDGSCPI